VTQKGVLLDRVEEEHTVGTWGVVASEEQLWVLLSEEAGRSGGGGLLSRY